MLKSGFEQRIKETSQLRRVVKDLAWKKQPLDLFPPCDTRLGLLKATHLRDIGQHCQFRQRSEPLVLFVNYGNSRPFVPLWSLVQTSGPLNLGHPLQQNHHLKISGCNDSTFWFYMRLSDQNSTKVQYTKQSQSWFIMFHQLKKKMLGAASKSFKPWRHFWQIQKMFPWMLCASSPGLRIKAGGDQTSGKYKAEF